MIHELKSILGLVEDPVVVKSMIREYLKNGSVGEDVISKRDLQKILKKHGIVQTAESKDDLSSTLSFLTYACKPGVNLKTAYLKAQASGFNVNVSEINEVVSQIKNGKITRAGTALVVVPQDYPDMILVGNDITTPDLVIGKFFGSLSLPMGYSELEENPLDQIKRVSQREIWSEQTVQDSFPSDVLPKRPRPFMYIKIAHIGVECYFIKLPSRLCNPGLFSSSKLIGHKFVNAGGILAAKEIYRTGVKEIVTGYTELIRELIVGYRVSPFIKTADINRRVMSTFV
ncbi:hypothetical protein HY045_00775 [Candidatus Woesebacteria bacterium]|nr:hypothetical protein [Candidatus Woesebacteria bacterium]